MGRRGEDRTKSAGRSRVITLLGEGGEALSERGSKEKVIVFNLKV